MNRAPALVACVALLLGGLLTGCFASKETRQGADRLVLVYDDMPGVAGVRVQSGRDGQGAEFVETVVTLEADATTAEVTDLVLGHDARVDDAGLADGFSYRGLRLEYDATGRPSLTMRWLGPAEAAVVRSGVEHWFRVTSLVGPAIQLVLGSDGSELYGVQPADSHTVADVYSTLAADPEIGPGAPRGTSPATTALPYGSRSNRCRRRPSCRPGTRWSRRSACCPRRTRPCGLT